MEVMEYLRGLCPVVGEDDEGKMARDEALKLLGVQKNEAKKRVRRVSGEGMSTTFGGCPLPPQPVARSVTPSPDGELLRVRGELERVRRERDELAKEISVMHEGVY